MSLVKLSRKKKKTTVWGTTLGEFRRQVMDKRDFGCYGGVFPVPPLTHCLKGKGGALGERFNREGPEIPPVVEKSRGN